MANGGGEPVISNSKILEVQPNVVTVLADITIRGVDLDEAKAQSAKQAAEELRQSQDAR